MPDTPQQRIEALRWAAAHCRQEYYACEYAAQYAVKAGEHLTLAAIWRSRTDILTALADELDTCEDKRADPDFDATGSGMTEEDVRQAIRNYRREQREAKEA